MRKSCAARRSADLQMRWLHLDLRNTSQQNNLCTTSVRLLLWRFQSYYLLRDTIESCRSASQRWDCLANRCFPRSTVVKEEPTNTTGRKKEPPTTIAESHCRQTAAECRETRVKLYKWRQQMTHRMSLELGLMLRLYVTRCFYYNRKKNDFSCVPNANLH